MNAATWYQPTETMLLTGAGFTKTFGGYLGSEMWAAILNQPEVQHDPALRKCMFGAEGLNYEAAYNKVQESDEFTAEQKSCFTSAVLRAYEQMDDIIRLRRVQPAFNSRFWIRRFGGSDNPRSRGFFFTLNQDLFIERFYRNDGDSGTQLTLPGVYSDEWFKDGGAFKPVDLPTSGKLEIVQQKFWEKGHGRFVYIKLHGSYRWRSQDGSDVMVIGYGKEGKIEKEPLLRWYMSLFEEVLNAGDRKLLVVGYGFGDEHINQVIARAIREKGLKLYVACPMSPQEFMNHLLGLSGNVTRKPCCDQLWDGLFGYYPGEVTDFYNPDQYSSLSPQAEGFFRALDLS